MPSSDSLSVHRRVKPGYPVNVRLDTDLARVLVLSGPRLKMPVRQESSATGMKWSLAVELVSKRQSVSGCSGGGREFGDSTDWKVSQPGDG